jgi:type VI protein secretion system component VasF
METYYTHQRGLEFFLECTGMAFQGQYLFKISNVGELAIESLRAGNESWIWNRLEDIPQPRRVN